MCHKHVPSTNTQTHIRVCSTLDDKQTEEKTKKKIQLRNHSVSLSRFQTCQIKTFSKLLFQRFSHFFFLLLVPPLKFNRNWMSNSMPPSPPPRLPLPTITTAHSTHTHVNEWNFIRNASKSKQILLFFFSSFLSVFFLCACIVLHLISEIFWHEHRTCNQLAEINTKKKNWTKSAIPRRMQCVRLNFLILFDCSSHQRLCSAANMAFGIRRKSEQKQNAVFI